MQVLRPSLAGCPGLQLVHGIPSRIEVMVVNDLGQLGRVAAVVTGMLQAPGLEFRIWNRRPTRLAWPKRNVVHRHS